MLRREASVWLARLQGGNDPETEAAFRRWRESDPAHAAAFERVKRSYASAGLLRHSELARDRSLQTELPRGRPQQPRWALAGAIALALLVPGAILVGQDGLSPFGTRNTVLLASSVGEIRRVTLEDGSKVTLDTATQVAVDLGRSERRAEVREGRARFEIAADARPFVVEAGTARVTSGPAVLDVERRGDEARVEVLSGSATASLDSAGQQPPVTVGAGEGFSSGQLGPFPLDADRSAWPSGMLQFDGTPLAEAVALANRYSDRKIVLAAGAGHLRLTGAFRAGDIPALAKGLARAFDLKLEHTRSGDFRLSPRLSSTARKKNGG